MSGSTRLDDIVVGYVRRRKKAPEPMEDILREAKRLGMSYGQFSAYCRDKFPTAARPIESYMESSLCGDREENRNLEQAWIQAHQVNHKDGPCIIVREGSSEQRSEARCKWCGEEFTRNRLYEVCCCDEHKQEWRRHQRRVQNKRTACRATEARWKRPTDPEILEMLDNDIVPGLPDEKQCPYALRRWREKHEK